MHLKKIGKIMIWIIMISIIAFLLTMLIPLKFCLSSIPSDSDEDFYIIRYSRTMNRWLVIGDKSGFFDDGQSTLRIARSDGNSFGFYRSVSVDLFMQGDATTFIVYGTATINDDWDEKYYGDTTGAIRYTISCTHWGILGDIKTTNSLRSIFPKKYLNIYDYSWFDNLRDRMYSYLDGETLY